MDPLQYMDKIDKLPGSGTSFPRKHAFERTKRTYNYEKVHKNTPFLHLVPHYERVAILMPARTLPAAIQTLGIPSHLADSL